MSDEPRFAMIAETFDSMRARLDGLERLVQGVCVDVEAVPHLRARIHTVEAFLRAHGVPLSPDPVLDSQQPERCPVWLNNVDVCIHCSLYAGHPGEHMAAGNHTGPLVEHGWRWRS